MRLNLHARRMDPVERELPQLLLTSVERLSPAGDRWVQRAARAGTLIRVRAGAYVRAAEWEQATHDEQALVRTAAVVRSRYQDAILTRESAALILGIPIVGPRPKEVHLISGTGAAPRNQREVVWHRERLDGSDVIEYGGFLVTNPERTAFDLARTRAFASAVTGLDAVLAGRFEPTPARFDGQRFTQWHPEAVAPVDGAALLDRVASSSGARGIRSARRAVRFANPLAGSPGESLSRANIHLLGFPEPELQVPFQRSDGLGADVTDFHWPGFATAGEFDGFVKYHRDEFLEDMTPEEIVWLEKERERRLRRDHRLEVSRWTWDVARSLHRLRAELLAAGLPIVRRR